MEIRGQFQIIRLSEQDTLKLNLWLKMRHCQYNMDTVTRNMADILDMEDNDFMDYHHLSGKGAAKYSAVFAEMMVSYDEEKRQELFYQSVQEKMEDMSPQTMGIALYQSEEEENIYSLTTIANYDVDVEYRICITDEQGNEVELVQDFSGNNIVESFPGEPVTFKITVRLKDTGEICEEEFIYL